VYTVRVEAPIPDDLAAPLDADLDRIGGSYTWYGLPFAWRARARFGRIVGEQWNLRRPQVIAPGAIVDWWYVARRDPASLVLRSIDWFPGEGWLGYQITEHTLIQVGALRSKGIPGFLYWKALYPVHRRVFRALAVHRVNRAAPSPWGGAVAHRLLDACLSVRRFRVGRIAPSGRAESTDGTTQS
jgi:hypothetical protein